VKGQSEMKRSEIREAAFYLTFERLFYNGYENAEDMLIDATNEADIFDVPPDVEALFKGVSLKAEELDGIIARYSEKRQVSRIAKVSRAILRLALYEFLYDDKVPGNVAISEAVLLAKKFALEGDVQFINGVLGEFSRQTEGLEKVQNGSVS